jgi:branched-subunit amino acid aminotransferase/4-amino-4-deoxychorismate lyase
MEQLHYQTAQRPPGADDVRLIETMRYEPGRGVRHLHRHAARLARSARRFGFPFSEDGFHAEVQTAIAPLREGRKAERRPPSKVRLTLGAAGDFAAEAAPLAEREQHGPLRLVLSEERAHTADPFFKHKTTWRRVYRRAFEAAQQQGADEALLVNERGAVTEGTRANLFVGTGDALYTPPVRCGLLPGVGRGAWLGQAGAEERVLTPADLRSADALWLVSALRGRRRAVMHDAGCVLRDA